MDINEHCKRPPIIKEAKKISDEQGNRFENCFFSINFGSCSTIKNLYVFIVFRFFCLMETYLCFYGQRKLIMNNKKLLPPFLNIRSLWGSG